MSGLRQAVIVEQRIEDVGVLLDERLHIPAVGSTGVGPAQLMADDAHERPGVLFNLVRREQLWEDGVPKCLEKESPFSER